MAYLKERRRGMAYAPGAIAAIKVLIAAKFIMLGGVLGVSDRFKSFPLIGPLNESPGDDGFQYFIPHSVLHALHRNKRFLIHIKAAERRLSFRRGGQTAPTK